MQQHLRPDRARLSSYRPGSTHRNCRDFVQSIQICASLSASVGTALRAQIGGYLRACADQRLLRIVTDA